MRATLNKHKEIVMIIVGVTMIVVLVVARMYSDPVSKDAAPQEHAAAQEEVVNSQITPDLLCSYFRSPGENRFTRAQRDRIWKEQFKGQRVRWTGTVQDVGVIEWSEGRAVTLQCGQITARVHVERDQALRLMPRQQVTVEGSLEADCLLILFLEDGRVW